MPTEREVMTMVTDNLPKIIQQVKDSNPADGTERSKIKVTVNVKFKPLEIGVSVEW